MKSFRQWFPSSDEFGKDKMRIVRFLEFEAPFSISQLNNAVLI